MTAPRLILASASPRRRELLALLGLPYEVFTSDFDENSVPTHSLTPAAWVMRLAEGKAADVARKIENAVVIGADTTVVLMGEYLNKPRDPADACRMLRQLSGQTHQVYTGICVLNVLDGQVVGKATDVAVTDVTFDTISDQTIAAYVATGEPLDKAGAYGIQGDALGFIPHIHGDYFNVVGLPLSLLRQMLVPVFAHAAEPPTQPAFPFPR
jgi:septum formation protein